MKVLVALAAVVVLALLALFGVDTLGLRWVFGVAIPYVALAVFLGGVAARVVGWGRSPVPFHITTTCGQQRSLDWIPQARLENPSSTAGVLGRMALEILAFRSLFRGTRSEVRDGRLTFPSTKWLWAAGLAFHWTFLVVLFRHLRLALEPVPAVVKIADSLDGFLQIGAPPIYVTTWVFLGALGFLLARRLVLPAVRYISLPADYFPLFMLLGIGLTGAWMRHIAKIDVPAVKETIGGLLRFAPQPAPLSGVFYMHLFLVCVLVAYLPFSKLVHMAGVFLSPTRNLTGDSRARRHINPWNHPVPVHTYEEYEDEFRERMRDAGLPLDKE